MSESSTTERRTSRLGWWIFAALGVSVALILLSIGYPIWRQIELIRQVTSAGGDVRTETRGPEWLSRLVGNSISHGFYRVVSVSGPAVDDQLLLRLAPFQDIQYVGVSREAGGISGIRALARLPKLVTADLFESRFDDSGMEELAKCSALEHIGAGYTNITDAGLRHAGGLTQLKYLGLRGNDITDIGLTHLGSLTNLNVLNLSETHVTDAGLRHLDPLKSLEHVLMFDTPVTEPGIRDFVASHPSLEMIELSPDQISADGMDDLKRQRPKLKIVITVGENDGSGFSRRKPRR